MSYADARRVPPAELHALWRAAERRMARKELRLIEDLFAVAGLQSEVRTEGKRQKPGPRSIPVTLNARRERLQKEGYPTRRPAYSPERERRKLAAFWSAGGIDAAEVLIDMSGDPPEPAA